jgi:hypothetical protein
MFPLAIEKIKDAGATYLVPTLDYVRVFPQPDGPLKIVIDAEFAKEIDAHKEEQEQRDIITGNAVTEVVDAVTEAYPKMDVAK